MIVIRVELWSARTGAVTELARMFISNVGTHKNPGRGNYDGMTFFGQGKESLDRRLISKRAVVEDYPRNDLHVWNLVARMLKSMGYDK